MTLRAIRAKHARMEDRVCMTTRTRGWKACELTCCMALLTSHAFVTTSQWEVRPVMVEVCLIPVRGIMTSTAIHTKLPIMLIILLMAGITIGGRAGKLFVDMTRLTIHTGMCPLKFERRAIMIEICRCPPIGCVAIRATVTKLSLVWIIIAMTGVAVL